MNIEEFVLENTIKMREDFIKLFKEKFDYHTKAANEAQLVVERMWAENNRDKERIKSLKN